ncbi:NUDIX hydrolase [Burkholderia lata]|uniref:Nudix hydrolase domain-containing protein n=1 Tax=Burkholderia lata (strain ATCC 17760 / DSM 23089 / LMG 22485 / NCIMB 9086 / R18194 / 383) TaxID=482957 RepID=A0A6P2Q657_BURL3|nr:NUDIX hydrolase [Burkholderia lata]VWC18397.1 hypothetical protein BLA6863_05728 [Burkholderia lata]
MAQTYAVVRDSSKNFFIAVKNTKGFFFHTDNNGNGVIYQNGTVIKNGPGESALPGGGLAANTDPAIGAANEFQEETGVELRNFDGKLMPKEWHGVTGKYEYYGVYYQFSSAVFNDISSRAIANLRTGADAAAAIRNGKIKTYKDIFKTYPNCPGDNELATGSVWNLDRDWSRIQALNNSQSTSWFYEILKNLKNNI